MTVLDRFRSLFQVLGACKALDAMRDTLRDHERRLDDIEKRTHK